MIEEAKQKALESLLADDDVKTRRLVIEELFQQREKNLPLVLALSQSSNSRVSTQAHNILRKWEGKGCVELDSFSSAGGEIVHWHHLEQLCWLLAKTEYPHCNPSQDSAYLDLLAERVLEHYQTQSQTTEGKLHALQRVLVTEEKFTGDIDNYYQAANSYLNQVLERKQGIPLTLVLVYVFIANRLSWNLVGVNTPGHYLASLDGIIFDPFCEARILSIDELSERFGAELAQGKPEDFFPATPFHTAQRMLSNLMNSYNRSGEDEKLRRVFAYLQILQEKLI